MRGRSLSGGRPPYRDPLPRYQGPRLSLLHRLCAIFQQFDAVLVGDRYFSHHRVNSYANVYNPLEWYQHALLRHLIQIDNLTLVPLHHHHLRSHKRLRLGDDCVIECIPVILVDRYEGVYLVWKAVHAALPRNFSSEPNNVLRHQSAISILPTPLRTAASAALAPAAAFAAAATAAGLVAVTIFGGSGTLCVPIAMLLIWQTSEQKTRLRPSAVCVTRVARSQTFSGSSKVSFSAFRS